MTRYIPAFSWPDTIQRFLESVVTEKPLLNICSGKTRWGDITLDKYEPADIKGDWLSLPFKDNSFGAVFTDPPWDAPYKPQIAKFMREALRVAPVVYIMSPWVYGGKAARLTSIWVRQLPGINTAILLIRYERGEAFR